MVDIAIIKVIDVCVNYGSHRALNNISLEVMPREVVAVVGPNGSGKTTLLKTIDRILKPIRGSIYIDGRNIESYVQRELAKVVAYVPQKIDLGTYMTVIDFVLTGRRPYAEFSYSKIDVDRAVNALRAVDAEHLMLRKLNQLSGGELQRVVIARALASEPKILLLDEPTANLDPRYQLEVLNLIKKLSLENGIAVIMAIHDLSHAYRFSDKVIMIKNGEIVAVGHPEEVLTEENIEKVFEVRAKVFRDIKAIVIG